MKERKSFYSRRYFLLVLLLASAFSATSWADNREILKALYDVGTEPASTKAFARTDYYTGYLLDSVANTCVIVSAGDHPYFWDISNVVRVNPPAGPLLPGGTFKKLVFGDVRQSFNLTQAPVVQGKDLVINNPIYRSWMDSSNGTHHFVAAQLFIRNSGPYMAFRLFIPHDMPGYEDEEYYGYCYGPQGSIVTFP